MSIVLLSKGNLQDVAQMLVKCSKLRNIADSQTLNRLETLRIGQWPWGGANVRTHPEQLEVIKKQYIFRILAMFGIGTRKSQQHPPRVHVF